VKSPAAFFSGVRAPRTYRLAGLGCKVNQYEAQLIAERLESAGLASAAPGEPADLCLVNTCAVTAAAAAKSLKLLRQLARANRGARVVAAGCLVSHLGREEALRRSGAHLALTQEEKLGPEAAALAGLEKGVREKRCQTPFVRSTLKGRPGKRCLTPFLPAGPFRQKVPDTFFRGGISRFDGHARAFLKVQDGCAAGCAYCVVPALRGRPRSRALAEVAAEARRLAAAGHREMVLSGVHLGWWGRDLAGRTELADLVEAVLAAAPRARVRLSSLEATELSGRLLALAAGEPRLCPHFHLPLQSGSDAVLKAMRRRYSAAEFLAAAERARARLERPAITTDVMVGFPGESPADFAATLEVCRRAGFSRLHVFPFSPRRGTPAAELPGRVEPAEARRRARELIALGRELAAAFAAGCVGGTEEVLAEEAGRAGCLAGYSSRYLRTGVALGKGQAPRLREIYRVRVERAEGARLFGSADGQLPP
jgi:threonylcarbamoyladenosine tRNA methylthiotransferase MtaB